MTNKPSSTPITVIKQNTAGEETWRYAGEVIERRDNLIIIEAYFDRDDALFHGMWLCKGDRFIETYYTDRWYNIFEIYDRENDQLKGWYCNITTPAVIEEQTIYYNDLALDLLVFPDGRQLVLDEDEFIDLDLSKEIQGMACSALDELSNIFTKKLS